MRPQPSPWTAEAAHRRAIGAKMMMLHQAKEAPQSSSEGTSEAEDGRGSQSSLSISKPIEELKMKIKETRDKRLIQTLQGIDLYAAEKMFSPEEIKAALATDEDATKCTEEEQAAIRVQSLYRGFKGRKVYLEKLFQKFQLEEENRMYIQKYQVEEGELLIREQNARLQLQDAKLIVRNRRATTEYNARLIQKCYRKWRKKIGSHEIRRSAVVTADMVDGGAVSIGDILVEPAST